MSSLIEPAGPWNFLNAVPNVVLWQAKDPDSLAFISPGVCTLLGSEPEMVLENPSLWANRVYTRHRSRYRRVLDLVRESGRPSEVNYRATLREGEAMWLRDHVSFDAVTGMYQGVTIRIGDEHDTEERLAFLNKAGKLLGSSLNTRELLRRLANLIVGSLADICIIEVKDEGQQITIAQSQDGPELARALEEPGPMLLARSSLPARVRNGRAAHYPRVTPRQLLAIVGRERHSLLEDSECHAAIIAPLVVRNRTLGVVTFLCTDPGKNYVAKDVELAEEICRQAATALDHARLFAQAEKARDALTRENEMKDEFLGIMSHELRTPLTVIYGASRMLPRILPDVDEDGRALIEDLYTASDRTVRLVDDLMLLARLNLGEKPDLEPIEVPEFLEEIAEDFVKQYSSRTVRRSVGETDIVLAAPAFLRQILVNLLSNAHKYSPPEAPIMMGAGTTDGEIVFFVQDGGTGLPEKELDEIFNRFYRSSNSHGVSGAGLGLAICKRLCEAQGGRIWADNVASGGFRVSVALPSSPSAS